MPEGPQVLKTRIMLNNKLVGSKVTSISVRGGRYKTKHIFDTLELPLTVTKIGSKGKFMWWQFNSDQIMFNTLGMSGLWTTIDDKHSHIMFSYKKDGKKRNIYFNDVRNFGTFKITDKIELGKKLKELGPDVLLEDDFQEFNKRIKRKRTNPEIGLVLMDQKVISGIGNYLRADILWQARTSPFRRLESFTEDELMEKSQTARYISLRSYEYKTRRKISDSIKCIVSMHFIIYNQKNDPNGNPVLTAKLGDRTVHYVKDWQK